MHAFARWLEREEMSMNEAAKQMGCDVSTVSRICRGVVRPSPEVGNKIIKLTRNELSWNDLMRDT